MRKVLSLTLAVILIMAVTIPAFAADSCTHSWQANAPTYVDGKGINATSTTCQRYTVTTKTCTKCGATQVSYSYSSAMSHSGTIKSASCNGTVQTHTYLCRYCNTYYTKTVTCPGAGHTGGCQYLPI